MTPHEGPSNTLPEHTARLESTIRDRDSGGAKRKTSVRSWNSIAYPPDTHDHLYIHRLGQSQDCELRGLAERTGPGSSTVRQHGMGALGASIAGPGTQPGGALRVLPGTFENKPFPGQLGDAEKFR